MLCKLNSQSIGGIFALVFDRYVARPLAENDKICVMTLARIKISRHANFLALLVFSVQDP